MKDSLDKGFKLFCISVLRLAGWKLYVAVCLYHFVYYLLDNIVIRPILEERDRVKRMHQRIAIRQKMYSHVKDIAEVKGLKTAIKYMYQQQKKEEG